MNFVLYAAQNSTELTTVRHGQTACTHKKKKENEIMKKRRRSKLTSKISYEI